METTIILGAVLVATVVVERIYNTDIPNKWVVLVLIGVVSWNLYSGEPIRFASGITFFVGTYLAWRHGAVGGGLTKLSLGVGGLLSLTAAVSGVLGFASAVFLTARFMPRFKSGEMLVPSSVVLGLMSAVGLATHAALYGVSTLP